MLWAVAGAIVAISEGSLAPGLVDSWSVRQASCPKIIHARGINLHCNETHFDSGPCCPKFIHFRCDALRHSLCRHSQLDCIVRGVHKILLRAEIPFRRLNGSVAQQQLDLLKLAAAGAA